MLQSKLFGKTIREAPKDEVSTNAILLSRAGYIEKLMAGVYSYLPLGLKVLAKIKDIVREEMDNIGGQEILMPALHPKKIWAETKRWDSLKEIMFQFTGRGDKEYGLGATHEEIVVDIARKRIDSYRDLPVYLYQIQDKFRNEPRAKSGLLRGREFSMKDLYSFNKNQQDLDEFYQQAIIAYQRIFERCGLKSIVCEASGGVFTNEYSHEFQVATPYGEDEIISCANGDFAQNTEVCQLAVGDKCPKCGQAVESLKSIEVGNIFKLGRKYSHDMGLTFADEACKKQEVVMGCYGIGPSRVMGAVVEIHHDGKGIIWPLNLTPYHVHLLLLDNKKKSLAEKFYQDLCRAGWEVLYDERDVSAGIKLKDADLMGIAVQFVIGAKTGDQQAEYRFRSGRDQGKVKISCFSDLLNKIY